MGRGDAVGVARGVLTSTAEPPTLAASSTAGSCCCTSYVLRDMGMLMTSVAGSQM